jgi:succinyl-CoA synthetase beta subunit
VVKAFRTVLADPGVEVMLVNIFAGINRCDWVAEGVEDRHDAGEVSDTSSVNGVAHHAGTHRSFCDAPANCELSTTSYG